MKVLLFIFIVLFVSACQHPSKVSHIEVQNNSQDGSKLMAELSKQYCPTTKEYITTYEYLKSKKTYFKADWASRVSSQVAKGCDGAALRFIKVFELMVRAEAYVGDAAKLGVEAANSTDDVAESFVEVFQKAYLKNYLDLDMSSSLTLARGLSFKYEGKVVNAKKDFSELVKFCISQKTLDLSRPFCAKMAYRFAQYGEKTPQGIYDAFIVSYNYLTTGNGPKVAVPTALKVSEDLIKVSPMAVYNFIKAYEYGISQNGKSLPVAEAVRFAATLGKGSFRLPASIEGVKTEQPASSPK